MKLKDDIIDLIKKQLILHKIGTKHKMLISFRYIIYVWNCLIFPVI